MSNNISPEGMLGIGTTLQMGKYRIDRYLASGGFGNTYLARNVNLDKPMVIKEFFMRGITGRDMDSGCRVTVTLSENKPLYDKQLKKFRREAQRIYDLNHKNIVRVHDLFDENDTSYYVMDFIEGESLSTRLKRQGPLDENEVRALLPQIMDALNEVHLHGIFHLDLKPGNIMIDNKGVLRLIDFGASKQTDTDGQTTSTSLTFTPGFAAPEQMHNQLEKIGAWTDIYALGATLYNLLTNTAPPGALDILYNGTDDDTFVYPDVVSQPMREFVRQLMNPNYKGRPQDITTVRLMFSALPHIAPSVTRQNIVSPTSERNAGDPLQYPSQQPSQQSMQPSYPSYPSHPSQQPLADNGFPSQQPIEDDDPEATIARAHISQRFSEMNNPQPRRQQEKKKTNKKALVVALLAAALIIGGLLIFLLMPHGQEQGDNTATTASTSVTAVSTSTTVTKTVENEKMTQADGTVFTYSGEVDEHNRANGKGHGAYPGGIYDGQYKDGLMDGEGVYTIEGDSRFEGTMKGDCYYEGKLTYLSDNAYFKGTFFTSGSNKWSPKDGVFYDAQGKETNVVNGNFQ